MPSKSQDSQRFFNFVHAVQKGKASAKGYDKVQEAADEMKPSSVEHFMGRNHIDKSLPKRATCNCGKCPSCVGHPDEAEDKALIKKLVKSEALKKEAFIRGFTKAAESSWIGRYLAMKGAPGAVALENPGKYTAGTIAGGLPFNLAAGAANTVLPGAGIPLQIIGGPFSATGAALASAGFDEDKRKKSYTESVNNTRKRSTLGNMWEGAKQYGKFTLPLGLLAGGIAGGFSAKDSVDYFKSRLAEDPTNSIAQDFLNNKLNSIPAGILGGAGMGLGAGIGLAGLQGLVGGGLSSAINKNTSDETRKRAIAMKAKHPFLTSLPFGDMIGAAM